MSKVNMKAYEKVVHEDILVLARESENYSIEFFEHEIRLENKTTGIGCSIVEEADASDEEDWAVYLVVDDNNLSYTDGFSLVPSLMIGSQILQEIGEYKRLNLEPTEQAEVA